MATARTGAGALTPGKPAVLVEGELDALTVVQVAGDLITPVALGNTEGTRRGCWIGALALCSFVGVAPDAGTDLHRGERSAGWWVGLVPHARRRRPW